MAVFLVERAPQVVAMQLFAISHLAGQLNVVAMTDVVRHRARSFALSWPVRQE